MGGALATIPTMRAMRGADSVTGNASPVCQLCDFENLDDDRIVFRDDLWAAEIGPELEVPGWFVLRTRRHAERLTGLEADELDTFAWRARNLVAATEQVTDVPMTYMLLFGDNNPHFHVLVIARGDDIPEDRRGGKILTLSKELHDPLRAVELTAEVRTAYRQLSSEARGT